MTDLKKIKLEDQYAYQTKGDQNKEADNWIVLEDTEDFTAVQLYDFLKVTKLYENIFTPETIDSVFELSPKDIIKIVSTLSKGMKSTIATRAKNKIDAKELDSNNKIEALEEALNVKFSI